MAGTAATDQGFAPGNVMPLTGDFTLTQRTAASDQITVQQVSASTGNIINAKNSSGTAIFTVGPNGALAINDTAAADIPIKVTQASAASGDALQILNNSASKVFQVNSAGAVRTMALTTVAIASLASNASASYSFTGLTTDDAVQLVVLKTPTVANGVPLAFAQGAARFDVYAAGGSFASNTCAIWAFRTTAN